VAQPGDQDKLRGRREKMLFAGSKRKTIEKEERGPRQIKTGVIGSWLGGTLQSCP